MDISIVVPLLNEEESIQELYDWIAGVMRSNHFSYEVIFVDDGSEDGSWRVIRDLSEKHPEVRALKFQLNYGKSQALNAAFREAAGDVVITMDADLQDNPEEIPELVSMIREDGFDLVSGWKKKRYDSKLRKNLPSKLFNAAARKTSGLKLHDFNCGLKAYKNQVVKNVDVYGEMHRYIPVLAKNAGFTNIGEKVVQHQARKYGSTKFGMDRFINGFLDLITIHFLTRFGKRPMHLFGLLGTLMFVLGFAAALYIGIVKLLKLYWKEPTILVTDNPWFYIALSCMIIGSQFFLAGFLGELILRSRERPSRYKIRETLNLGSKNDREDAK